MAREDGCLPMSILLEEAATVLTPQERRYLEYACAERAACGPCPFTDANRWKLFGRVWRKLSAFFGRSN
jgi:hypothetical protein